MEQYNTLPCLNITSPNTFHHLTNSDVDLNMPVDQYFSYYSIENFKSNYDIKECSSNKTSFSALNCNIRSLPANYDNFMHMLSELNFPFSLLGFSETKFKVDQERLVNVNIPGYNLISEPSLSNAGGVAFYVKNNLKFSVRSDITTVDQNFEAHHTLWINWYIPKSLSSFILVHWFRLDRRVPWWYLGYQVLISKHFEEQNLQG